MEREPLLTSRCTSSQISALECGTQFTALESSGVLVKNVDSWTPLQTFWGGTLESTKGESSDHSRLRIYSVLCIYLCVCCIHMCVRTHHTKMGSYLLFSFNIVTYLFTSSMLLIYLHCVILYGCPIIDLTNPFNTRCWSYF